MSYLIQDSITKAFLSYDEDDVCELVSKDKAKRWACEEDAKGALIYFTGERTLPHGSFHPVREDSV